MTIMAIDPGNKQSAFVIWSGEKIYDKGILPNQELSGYIEKLSPNFIDLLAIEKIACYGMAVGQEVFDTCIWIGRFWEQWHFVQPGEVELVLRMQVKMALCGTSRAKDSNIRQALIDRFGEPGTKKQPGVLYGVKADIWAALAVAVVTHDKITFKSKYGIDGR